MWLKGRLPNFIKVFLSDRTFQGRIGPTLSNIQNQEEGVPQRNILSVTLFNIKISSITNNPNTGVDKYLFVDDFCITSTSKFHIYTYSRTSTAIGHQQNKQIDNDKRPQNFQNKTQCVHFCQLRKMHNNPTLNLDESEIPAVDQYKFFGVIFDKKLSFIPHIQFLKEKCRKTLKHFCVIAHKDWDVDTRNLLKLYRALICSKIDSSCFFLSFQFFYNITKIA